jgi:hypothetical protein
MRATPRRDVLRSFVVMLCISCLVPGDTLAYAASQAQKPASSGTPKAKIPAGQLDSLVAPIALYPDPLLAQVLAASTYPLEIVQLQQWMEKNKNLEDKELADAVAKQPWDPSVQALAGLPEAVKRLGDDIGWTTDLGNAFLAQQADVMDAIQRMRKKAQDKGTLKSSEQQTVETKVVETKQVIVIQQSNPQVIYVPTYDPVIVYGPPIYPYPPIYYPPAWYYPAGIAISFGVGMMMGAFWAGGWGWGCGWGGNNININNNNFNRNSNINGGNRVNNSLPGRGNGNGNRPGNGAGGNRPSNDLPGRGNGSNAGAGANRPNNDLPGRGSNAGAGGNRPSTLPAGGDRGNWQHNPEHRGGAPYSDRATADRFGGTARGDSLSQRQAGARQQISRQGSNFGSSRGPGGGLGNGAGGAGVSNRASAGAGNRSSGAGNRSFGGGPDSIGSRDLSRSGGGNRDAFGSGTQGYSGSNARNTSSRGMSSMGSRGGGGSSGGGGARGGGGRRR